MPVFLLVNLSFVLIMLGQLGASGVRQSHLNVTDSKPGQSRLACYDNRTPDSLLPPPGPECLKKELGQRGQPFMFSAHNDGSAFGVSSAPDKASKLTLWIDNQTDKAKSFFLCCTAALLSHIDVYDGEGHRLMSGEDLNREGGVTVVECSCAGNVVVPPHTIVPVDSTDIADPIHFYVLPPGKYVITEKTSTKDSNPTQEAASPIPPGLAISVR
jgi:hypothetical protein